MKVPPRFACVVAAVFLFAATSASGQNYTDLFFGNPVQATNGYHSQLGDYYTGTTFDFLDVAPSSGQGVDMRLTVTAVTSPRYSYEGALPDYSAAEGEPGGDLGFLLAYKGGAGSGGDFGPGSMTYNLEFFAGGSDFSDPFVIPDFRLMIYDIDGEGTQDESVAAFGEDGLLSYQLFSGTEIAVTDTGDGYFRFAGPGIVRDEDDPRTAFILRYQNTSSIRLQVIANTHPNSQNNNGVFGGIDGNLSLLNSSGLPAPVYLVPEPSSALLVALAAAAAAGRRRRKCSGG